jgi:hypothetical protein
LGLLIFVILNNCWVLLDGVKSYLIGRESCISDFTEQKNDLCAFPMILCSFFVLFVEETGWAEKGKEIEQFIIKGLHGWTGEQFCSAFLLV